MELVWHDSVNGQDAVFAIHHDFPDASRASAFATAFVPEGQALPPDVGNCEIAVSERAQVRLWEVP